MDTRFSDEELAFQAEVRQFFAEVMDDDLNAMLAAGEASPKLKEGMVEYQRRLNAKGWLAPGWPVEYGGQDWTATQHYIFNAERGNAGALAPIPFGVTMVARAKGRHFLVYNGEDTILYDEIPQKKAALTGRQTS